MPTEPGDRLVATRRSRATPMSLDIQANDVQQCTAFHGGGGQWGQMSAPLAGLCALRSRGTSSHLHQPAKGVGCGRVLVCVTMQSTDFGVKKSRFKFQVLCFPAW